MQTPKLILLIPRLIRSPGSIPDVGWVGCNQISKLVSVSKLDSQKSLKSQILNKNVVKWKISKKIENRFFIRCRTLRSFGSKTQFGHFWGRGPKLQQKWVYMLTYLEHIHNVNLCLTRVSRHIRWIALSMKLHQSLDGIQTMSDIHTQVE